MKFIFSILTCRSKTEGIGALMGIISTSLSTSQDRHLNICTVDTSWKTDMCIVGVRFNVSVSVHVHLCVNACVFAYIHSCDKRARSIITFKLELKSSGGSGIKASYDGMNMTYVWWVLFCHSLCIWVGLRACTFV